MNEKLTVTAIWTKNFSSINAIIRTLSGLGIVALFIANYALNQDLCDSLDRFGLGDLPKGGLAAKPGDRFMAYHGSIYYSSAPVRCVSYGESIVPSSCRGR